MIERVVRFGGGAALTGVLAESAAGAKSRLAAIFLNAGVVHHVGPNRLWVDLCRDTARAGVPAMRFDFSGIGDSRARADHLPFERSAVSETREAMDLLARDCGAERFVLVGLCSGAEIAFKTAYADARVVAAVLINAPRFLDEPAPELVARLETAQAAQYTWRVSFLSPQSWVRFLTGRADYRGIWRALRARLAPAAGQAGAENGDAEAFRVLARRGVKLRLTLAEGDWGVGYLRAVLGSGLESLQQEGAVHLDIVPGADHLMTPFQARERTRAAVRAVIEHTRN